MPASRVRSPARHTCSDPVTPAFGTSSSASQPGTSTGCVWGFRRTDSCAEVIVGKGGRWLVRSAGALSCPGVRGSSGVEANEEEGADGARRMANGVRAFTLTIFLPSPASELRQKGRRKSDALLLGADDRAQAPVQLLRAHRGPRGIAVIDQCIPHGWDSTVRRRLRAADSRAAPAAEIRRAVSFGISSSQCSFGTRETTSGMVDPRPWGAGTAAREQQAEHSHTMK
ncbi:hypothetical protein FB451DRAFT_1176789 [Mycena latifolia]|nr:hypothetical protein FB451DRAFT_1176789 [Mycena latifolia]